jgi:hypothetical protein
MVCHHNMTGLTQSCQIVQGFLAKVEIGPVMALKRIRAITKATTKIVALETGQTHGLPIGALIMRGIEGHRGLSRKQS